MKMITEINIKNNEQIIIIREANYTPNVSASMKILNFPFVSLTVTCK